MNDMDTAENIPKKIRGPIVNPGLCRGCRSIKKCRLLTTEYQYMGNKEVYSHMFMDVFGLLLSHLEDDEKDLCICATCVLRLREASAFRHQVLRSEEVFLETKLNNSDDTILDLKYEVKNEIEENESYENEDRDELPSQESQSVPSPSDKVIETLEGNEKPKTTKQTKVKVTPDELLCHKMETKVHMLKDKLEQMLDKPAESPNKSKMNKKTREATAEDMAVSNTVIIVNNSYVIPFQNRISNYYCYYCKDQFTNPNELREHTLQHNPTELFQNSLECKRTPKIDITRIDCRLCDAEIDDLDTFRSHINNVHGIELFPVQNEFLKFKLTLENLTCTECNAKFPYFDALKKHMIEHFGTLVCDICGACFLERNSLRTHIKSHSKVESNFPCEICGKNLKSKYSRYLHVATVHEKRPTVNCYKCDATFMSYALRNRHLIEVHGDKRTFPCKSCDKVYNRRKTLMEHTRRNHLKILRHQCNFCDQRFYLPSRLKEHMATHTGDKIYKCNICSKTYPRLQSLQDHMKLHTNEKKFKCHLCVCVFSQQSTWKNHLKNHHLGYASNSNFG